MARTQQSFRRKSHGVSERRRELRACPNVTVYRLLEAHLRGGFKKRRRWPLIILRSPKGWTGPKVVDAKPTE